MINNSQKILFGIPSKGRMSNSTLEFLKACGIEINKKNRSYLGTISNYPQIQIVFQNQEDIVYGVEGGSLSFGIVGYDLVQELSNPISPELIVLYDDFDFGKCNLEIAIPKEWKVSTIEEIFEVKQNIRIGTKFPKCTNHFLNKFKKNYSIIKGNGTIELYPSLGYCDIIVDLVSSGDTLEANQLKRVSDGLIFSSTAVFIGNRTELENKEILELVKNFIEIFDAFQRGKNFVQITANIKDCNLNSLIPKIFSIPGLNGLQGPTVSPVFTQNHGIWNAIQIVVKRENLYEVIKKLRSIGGSGVIVTPTTYIFEEEPIAYKQLQKILDFSHKNCKDVDDQVGLVLISDDERGV